MPLAKLQEEVESLKEELNEKVESLEEEKKEIKKDLKNLQKNIGVVGVYKDVATSYKKMDVFKNIIIIILSVALFISLALLIHNDKKFDEYRENSIHKTDFENITGDNI